MSEPLHVEVSELAAGHIRAAEAWWRSNRPKAPNAIREELERASSLIAVQPGLAHWLGTRLCLESAACISHAFATTSITVLLPQPPKKKPVHIEFRDISGRETRALNPTERRFMRQVHRIQPVLAWIAVELDQPGASLRRYNLSDDAERTAAAAGLAFSIKSI